MRKPFNGDYPISRPFIKNDPTMPKNLWDPIYGPTHRGIDWALPVGTPLVAAISGQVTAAGFSPDGAGNIVVIKDGTLYVKCFHMSAISVRVGQQVKEGDVIGASGATGNATGPHLHFQVEQPFAIPIDPVQLLDNTAKEEAVYPNKQDVIDVLADRGVVASPDEQEKWGTVKFRWPEFWKDMKRAYPVPFATTPDFVRAMCSARGFEPSEGELSKWSGWKPQDFMEDLAKQYPYHATDAEKELKSLKATLKELAE